MCHGGELGQPQEGKDSKSIVLKGSNGFDFKKQKSSQNLEIKGAV